MPASPDDAINNAMAKDGAGMLMDEIYASLVIATTLAEEIRGLEDERAAAPQITQQVAVEAAEVLRAATADAEAMEQAASDALHAAMHERTLRMRQASKLRVLQTASAEKAPVLAELEAERKRGQQRERALREAQAKAQQATERQMAASHSLKAERQLALRSSRALSARRLASLSRQEAGRALAHCFTSWAAKVAVGIHTPAQYHPGTALPPDVQHAGCPPMPAAYADGHAQLHAALDARTAECLRLRSQLAKLEATLAVSSQLQQALKRSTDRAAEASHALLEARRAQASLSAENAELRARVAGLLAEGGLGSSGGRTVVAEHAHNVHTPRTGYGR